MLAATILAVSTAPGVGSRAVLRLSGPRAVDAVASLAVDRETLDHIAGFSGVDLELSLDGNELSVWAMRFRAPRSYTRPSSAVTGSSGSGAASGGAGAGV